MAQVSACYLLRCIFSLLQDFIVCSYVSYSFTSLKSPNPQSLRRESHLDTGRAFWRPFRKLLVQSYCTVSFENLSHSACTPWALLAAELVNSSCILIGCLIFHVYKHTNDELVALRRESNVSLRRCTARIGSVNFWYGRNEKSIGRCPVQQTTVYRFMILRN